MIFTENQKEIDVILILKSRYRTTGNGYRLTAKRKTLWIKKTIYNVIIHNYLILSSGKDIVIPELSVRSIKNKYTSNKAFELLNHGELRTRAHYQLLTKDDIQISPFVASKKVKDVIRSFQIFGSYSSGGVGWILRFPLFI